MKTTVTQTFSINMSLHYVHDLDLNATLYLLEKLKCDLKDFLH